MEMSGSPAWANGAPYLKNAVARGEQIIGISYPRMMPAATVQGVTAHLRQWGDR